MEIRGKMTESVRQILTPEAQAFLEELHRRFDPTRKRLLSDRHARARRIAAGEVPGFLDSTRSIRESDWKVAPVPRDLQDRRVEITGPAEPKMMINALNSGAKVFMADFEDALSPTWQNLIEGQVALKQAVRRELRFESPEGKRYELKAETATLVVRPRGWHLNEEHVHVDGEPMSASLFDFGLYFYHNAIESLERRTGPYFYLPKMESHLEARLWNDVFVYAQEKLRIPRGTVRATVLIETILAAYEMEEILYELREHAAGLNAGRWDYIFSAIKKFAMLPSTPVFPDRGQITMTVPFMRAYTELLVRTCHRRGAHAMGGMAAFIPSRRDREVNDRALSKVREDKERESKDGFDGTWVAHPDLVPVALEVFEKNLSGKPNQKERLREDVRVEGPELIDFKIPGGSTSEQGIRNNIEVAIVYIANWLAGLGAVAIHNLMEDAATAEISRAQLWQAVHREALLSDGRKMSEALYRSIRDEELSRLASQPAGSLPYAEAAQLLDRLVLSKEFPEFLTLGAYAQLVRSQN